MNFSEHHLSDPGMEKSGNESSSPEAIHYEPKFKQIQEDLHNMFNIEVTSETSLRYPWVIDELYTAAKKELLNGTPWGFDYMWNEKLLTKEQILKHGVTEEMKEKALEILNSLKGYQKTTAKELFEETGILETEDVKEI